MSDRENAQRGPENPPEPHVVDPDKVVLTGTGGGGGTVPPAAGPELSVSAEELTLAEPELAPAAISPEAAEAVALGETAEETRSAAEEAAEAGVLAAGPLPRNAPAVQAAPSGTAPAGGPAGDAAADTTGSAAGDTPGHPGGGPGAAPGAGASAPARDVPDTPAGSAAGETTGEDHGPAARPGGTGKAGEAGNGTDRAGDRVSPVPVLSTAGGPGLYAGTDPAAVGVGPAVRAGGSGTGVRTGSTAVSPKSRQAPPAPGAAPSSAPARSPWAPAGDETPAVGPRRARSREQRGTKPRPLLPLVLGAVAVLALLAWGITSLVRGFTGSGDPQTVQIPTAAGADGVLAENVAPSALTAGQCLLDFTGISNEVTIVTCTTPHRAQLIASEFYPDNADFPGRDQLGARAKAACDAADINTGAAAGAGRIELLHVTPTEGTWADDDRRVDCFAVVEKGATLSRSLLNE